MTHSCTAPDIILTAAHCVLDAHSLVVTAGAHNRTGPEATQQTEVAQEATIHPDWVKYVVENDIAIIRTVDPFTFNGGPLATDHHFY